MKEGDGDWVEIVTVVDSLAYTVKNITPGNAYRFRVRAENIHGRSEPSLPSDEIIVSAISYYDGGKPHSLLMFLNFNLVQTKFQMIAKSY